MVPRKNTLQVQKMPLPKNQPILIAFRHLGSYELHTHDLDKKGNISRGSTPFNCAIRNGIEQKTERLEIHPGEELHANGQPQKHILEQPLLRYDENGLWAWFTKRELWWPLRKIDVEIGLSSSGQARLIWENG